MPFLWWVLGMLVMMAGLGLIGVALQWWTQRAVSGGRVRELEAEVASLRARLDAAERVPLATGHLHPDPAAPEPSPAGASTWPLRSAGEETITVAGRALPATVVAEVDGMRGRDVAAIKLVRERTGMGLADAKAVVDAIRADRY